MKALWKMGLSVVIVLSLVALAACESGSKSGSSPSTSTQSAGQGESGNEAVKEEYVIKVLTQSAIKQKRSDETEIGQIIKDKFNLVFEFVQTPGNMVDKLNLMLAGGDYPEIVAISDNVTFDKYARAGALRPLDDFVKSAPEFAKRYEVQIPLWKLAGPDGKLYKWEGGVPQNFENLVEVNDVGVRIDALKQQGWPNLVSTDDYIRFLKQALKDNPTTNGQKTIGMVVPFGEPWGIQGVSGIMYEKGGRYFAAAGNLGVVWNDAEQNFEDYMLNEYVKEGLQFFNDLYREGILDKDSFTDKADQVQEKLNSGRALSTWYYVWGLGDSNQGLIKAGHPEMQYINMPVRSMTQVERNEKRLIRVEDSRPNAIYAITKNAKHPERIEELLAWAATEEGKLLLQSGIEGKHYTIQDSKRVPTEAYLSALKDSEKYNAIGFGLFDFLGNVATNAPDGSPYSMNQNSEIRDDLTLTPEAKDAFHQLGWASSKDYFLKTGVSAHTGVISTISLDTTSEIGALQQKMVDFRVKNSAKLIVEPKTDEQFEALYQSIVAEYMKLKPNEVVDEYNRLYQEKASQLDQHK